jgi:hypothetical protein
MNSVKLKYAAIWMTLLSSAYSVTVGAQPTTATPVQAGGPLASPVEDSRKVQIPDEALLAQPRSAADPKSANQSVSYDDWVSEFEKKFGQSVTRTLNGKTFYDVRVPIRVTPTDTNYVKYLSVAYSTAMLQLQTNYVLSLYGDLRANAFRDFFRDDSTNARTFPDIDKELEKINTGSMTQQNRIINKTLKAIEGSLDKKLVEQGVDSAKVKQLTIPQKKTLLINNISLPSFKSAANSVSGLVPVQTRLFTEIDPMTKRAVVSLGIIAVISEKTTQFAADILRLNSTTNIKGTPRPLSFYLPQSAEDRINTIGLRYGYDEQGRPMLISFGQWSVFQKTDDAALSMTLQQSAERTAQINAETYIAFFAQTALSVSATQNIEAQQENALKQINKVDASTGELIESSVSPAGLVSELLDIQLEKARAEAKIKLRGISPYRGWTEVGADGLTRIGKIVIWSYSDLENHNRMSQPQSGKVENRAFVPQTGASKLVNTKDDF